MGLQRIGDLSFSELLGVLQDWSNDASLYELRAVVAALAEPRLLGDPSAILLAWPFAESALGRLHECPVTERRTPDFIALRKGLEYALSVLVAADPETGFARLREFAEIQDKDVKRVIQENLKKKRLAGRYPQQTKVVQSILDQMT